MKRESDEIQTVDEGVVLKLRPVMNEFKISHAGVRK